MSKNLSRIEARINSQIGRAIKNYRLIEEGDKILVAVSGGKDSLTLLTLLNKIRTWAPVRFELIAAHVRTDFHCAACVHEDYLTRLFEGMKVPYVFRSIKVLDEKKKTDCFWCSWNRRKALFTAVRELGCNKLAFGHHKDDIVETILMNLMFNGNISGMNPCQELFGGKLQLIRPLCYVEEKKIREYAKEKGFVQAACRCPFSRDSKRKYIKDFIQQTQQQTVGINIRSNIFKSLSRVKAQYMDIREEVTPKAFAKSLWEGDKERPDEKD